MFLARSSSTVSHPRTDPGRLERGPLAPKRLSLSGPSLLPRHRSERRCFKCQTGHTCKACRLCLNTRPVCLVSPLCRPLSKAEAHCLGTVNLQGGRELIQKKTCSVVNCRVLKIYCWIPHKYICLQHFVLFFALCCELNVRSVCCTCVFVCICMYFQKLTNGKQRAGSGVRFEITTVVASNSMW